MREKLRDSGRLRHMLHAMENICRFMADKTLDDFVRLCSDVDTLTHAQPFSECEFGYGGCLVGCWPF